MRIDNTAGHGPVGWSRRRLLRGMAMLAAGTSAAPLAGCGLFDHHQSDATPDALQPLVTEALELAARYEAAVGAFPELADRLGPVAQDHRAHAAQLARVTGTALPSATATGSAAPPAADPKAELAALRSAEQRGRESAAAACIAAPAGRATLVGTIAAARAAHLEVLR